MGKEDQNDKKIDAEQKQDVASAEDEKKKTAEPDAAPDAKSGDSALSDKPSDHKEPGGDKRARSRSGRGVFNGVVHIQATFNNTLVSITDTKGDVIAWSSGGRMAFKGTRKSTAYAATIIAQEAARQAMTHGLREVEVKVQGPGAGRESAIRAIQAAGLNITAISDVTPIPHNGCRPRKRRRV